MKRSFDRILKLASLGLVQSQVNSDCFTSSNSAAGNQDIGNQFNHKTDLKSNAFTQSMQISEIRGCVSPEQRVTGITVTLQDSVLESMKLNLPAIGSTTEDCSTLKLQNSDSYIKTLEIGFDADGITHLMFISTDEVMQFGEVKRDSGTRKGRLSFEQDNQLIGFWGTSGQEINSIGIILYDNLCASEPVEVITDETPDDLEETFVGIVEPQPEVEESIAEDESTETNDGNQNEVSPDSDLVESEVDTNEEAEGINSEQNTQVTSHEEIASAQPATEQSSNGAVFVMIGIAVFIAIIIIVVVILLKRRKKTNEDKATSVKESEADEEIPSPSKDVPTYADQPSTKKLQENSVTVVEMVTEERIDPTEPVHVEKMNESEAFSEAEIGVIPSDEEDVIKNEELKDTIFPQDDSQVDASIAVLIKNPHSENTVISATPRRTCDTSVTPVFYPPQADQPTPRAAAQTGMPSPMQHDSDMESDVQDDAWSEEDQ